MNARHAAKMAAHKAAYQAQKAQERAEEEARNTARYIPERCAQCGAELDWDDCTGFCSARCEELYGECPICGAPSKGNRKCWDCATC